MRHVAVATIAVLLLLPALLVAAPPYGFFPTPDDLTVKTLTVDGTSTVTGVQTFTAQPIFSSLTASKPVFTDGSKGLVSTGTLGADQGGTGLATYAIGDIPYASAATTLSKLAGVAAGSYLRSGGVTTAPVWSTLTLPNTVTAGDTLHASAANTVSVLAKGTANQVYAMNAGATVPAWTSSPILQRPTTVGTTDTYALTAADCGRLYVATKTTATQVYTLPVVTTAGCMFTFIAGHADGEVLIDAVEGTGTNIIITTFAAVGADADTSIVTDTDGSPGIKNTAATNAVGDNCTLIADGVATWFSLGLCTGIWAAQ